MFCEHESAHFRLISAFVVVIKKTMLKKNTSLKIDVVGWDGNIWPGVCLGH